jgi:bifunctional non-homologous end joining protein LigD
MITHKDLAELRPTKLPFTRPRWAFELKYDGFRTLASRSHGEVRLISRKGTDLRPNFPEIEAALILLPWCVLDGELVVLNEKGHPQFDRLVRRLRMKRPEVIARASVEDPAVMFAFDLLELGGRDVRRQRYEKRKSMLREVLHDSTRVRYLSHIGEEGERLFKAAEKLGLEGIVAKPIDAPYYRGRESGWLKIKTSAGIATDAQRAQWNER